MDKDCLIYSLHTDFTIIICHESYSIPLLHLLTVYSFYSSFFCPSDIRLCGTVTWASSKAVSSKCIMTKAFSSRLASLLPSRSFSRFVFYPPPHPGRSCYVSPLDCAFSVHFISGDEFGFSIPMIAFCSPLFVLLVFFAVSVNLVCK